MPLIFGEYKSYAANFDARIVEVEPDFASFQPDLEKFTGKITAKTKIVLVNTPNNPTGVVYTEETLRGNGRDFKKKRSGNLKRTFT